MPPLTWQQIAVLLLGRFTLHTAFRLVYPLLPFLAGGLAVDLPTASLLITVQVSATLLSPLGGTLTDRYGERRVMIAGLALFVLGTAICAWTRAFQVFLLGYSLVGLSVALYLPAGMAYASVRTPYARRGRVLSLLELPWALAALVGVSGMTALAGWTTGWAVPFATLVALGLAALVATLVGLQGDRMPGAPLRRVVSPFGLLVRPQVVAALGFLAATLLAAELIWVVYAAWLEADFGAGTAQLGLVFSLLGAVELAGSALAAVLVDRLGKRRAVLLAFGLTAILQALVPATAGQWPLFLVVFGLYGLCLEFAIVATFPLLSGVAPDARGGMLSLGVAAIGLARVVGSLAGPALWVQAGFTANALLAGAITATAVGAGILFLREGEGA